MINKIHSSLAGDLILGELDEVRAGVCNVRYDDVTEDMIVYGENDMVVGTVSTTLWTTESVAQQVNKLIDEEHEQL